jgi:hypothetical protein
VFENAVKSLRSDLKNSGGQVTSGSLPRLIGNPTQLAQLLQNLIGNGLTYSAPDSTPHVHVEAERQDNGWLISVRDNGIGIPLESRNAIFEVFTACITTMITPEPGSAWPYVAASQSDTPATFGWRPRPIPEVPSISLCQTARPACDLRIWAQPYNHTKTKGHQQWPPKTYC